jgi:hypothetical protein
MFRKAPLDPLKPKWSAIKDSANLYCWVRITKWDFKKSLGKSSANIPKTIENKTFSHLTTSSPPRGLDSTGIPGQIDPKRKFLKKQLTKLDPKKTPNRLFAELLAFKFNIGASALQKTPAGLGELIYNNPGNAFDGMMLTDMAEAADQAMTHWQGHDSTYYAQLLAAVSAINRAFPGSIRDTATWMATDLLHPLGNLTMFGTVPLSAVPFLSAGPVPPRITTPANGYVEDPDPEFEDEEFEEMESEGTPIALKLYQNYPNPFNPTTTIAFRLLGPSAVTVSIYNMLGQEVGTLIRNEELEEGYQTVEFSAQNLASGVYFYRVTAQSLDEEVAGRMAPIVGKMLLVK